MRVKEESEKAGSKLHIQKTKILASSPITSWQIEGKKSRSRKSRNSNRLFSLWFFSPKSLQTVTEAMKLRLLLLRRKAMTNPDSVSESRDATLPAKACIVKATVFPLVIYHCESWTIKKPACMRNCFSLIQLFVTPGIVSHQAPLSMGFSRQEIGGGFHAILQKEG